MSLSKIALADVGDSWRRCQQYRLNPGASAAPIVLTQAELDRVRQPLERTLVSAREELDRLQQLVQPLGYATVLADSSGVIVERRCLEADARRFDEHGTRAGALWSEQLEGTNGIGSCIVERRPINVHRQQHFRQRHVDLSCSGAPIFDPQGELLAVLNISSDATALSDRSHALALAVAVDGARAIAERAFREAHRTRWVVALQGSAPAVSLLLALDRDQRIVEADHHARRLLAIDQRQLAAGIDLWSLYDRNPLALRSLAAGEHSLHLTRREGSEHWRGRVTPPHVHERGARSALEAALHASPRAAAPVSLALAPAAPTCGRGGLPPRLLRRLRRHIDEHLGSSIRVSDLARLAGLSVHHFSRAFKQSFGVAPQAYLLQQRVEKAAQLLARTELKLSEVAHAVGFADQSHFARCFLRLTGTTPGRFRRAQR